MDAKHEKIKQVQQVLKGLTSPDLTQSEKTQCWPFEKKEEKKESVLGYLFGIEKVWERYQATQAPGEEDIKKDELFTILREMAVSVPLDALQRWVHYDEVQRALKKKDIFDLVVFIPRKTFV
jgi:hypothetical protein